MYIRDEWLISSRYQILKPVLSLPELCVQSSVGSLPLSMEVDELSHVGLMVWEFQIGFWNPEEWCQLRSCALAPICFAGNMNCRSCFWRGSVYCTIPPRNGSSSNFWAVCIQLLPSVLQWLPSVYMYMLLWIGSFLNEK